MRVKYSKYLILTLLLAQMLTSCLPHDPLCLHHEHGMTKVVFDWSKAPDAYPHGMRVYFYRASDGVLVATSNFMGRDGGTVRLNSGEYMVMSHNNDTERLFWRNVDELSKLEAYTRKAGLTEELPSYSYPEEIPELVLTPDKLWCGGAKSVMINEADSNVVVLIPESVVYQVIWEVEGISGIDRANAGCITISGLGGSYFPDRGTTGASGAKMSSVGERYIVSQRNGATEAVGGFTGEMLVFGCEWLEECHHTLDIYCWSRGGNITRSFDVTTQFHKVTDDRKIYIKVTADFEIPNGNGNEGGGMFEPDLDQWGDIKEDIYL